jgi:hypothetical protein
MTLVRKTLGRRKELRRPLVRRKGQHKLFQRPSFFDWSTMMRMKT